MSDKKSTVALIVAGISAAGALGSAWISRSGVTEIEIKYANDSEVYEAQLAQMQEKYNEVQQLYDSLAEQMRAMETDVAAAAQARATETEPAARQGGENAPAKESAAPAGEAYLAADIAATDLNRATEYTPASGKSFSMGGISYNRGILLDRNGAALYYLSGNYATLEGVLGHHDGSGTYEVLFRIYFDGELAESYNLRYDTAPIPLSFDVTGVNQVKLLCTYSGIDGSRYGLADVVVKP